MEIKQTRPYRYWFVAATIILIAGGLIAVAIVIIGLQLVLPPIAKAANDPTQYIEVPGQTELLLSRTGAYALYSTHYRHPSEFTGRPPRLDCNIISLRTGAKVPLVANYIPTELKVGDRYLGAQIYSTTIDRPGVYSFKCQYLSGMAGPSANLAVGPNYVWEFLRGFGGFAGSLLGGLTAMCGATLLAILAAGIAFIQRSTHRRSVALAG